MPVQTPENTSNFTFLIYPQKKNNKKCKHKRIFHPYLTVQQKTQFQTTKKTSIICTKNFIGSIKANILLLLNISPQKNLSLYYLPLFRFFSLITQ